MPLSPIEDFRQIRTLMKGIPKRERSKMKRRVKVATIEVLEQNLQNRVSARHAYRRQWHLIAAQERLLRKMHAKA